MPTRELAEIRLLPPMAIARLGAANEPMDNFDVKIPAAGDLGWRTIKPASTFLIDEATGEITKAFVPTELRFRDSAGDIRPIAPFLELWARFTGERELRPLTMVQLDELGLGPPDVNWTVHVANHKIYRRTKTILSEEKAADDRIDCQVANISDHRRHRLVGQCKNFVKGKAIALGHVQYIKPTKEFPEIRFRLTPAAGRVYGPVPNPTGGEGRAKPEYVWEQVYRHDGPWVGYTGPTNSAVDTIPGQIFAGDANGISLGYLDDSCDGVVSVSLTVAGREFESFSRVMCGPPAFAPDSFPIRQILNELEMHFLGPEVAESVSNAEVREILRRAFENVRLMNTTVMNGNTVNGRVDVASTMVRQDSNDFNRLFAPIMAVGNVDNLAVIAIHENLFAVLKSHTPPWFVNAFRRYDEIGDLSDAGRRRMPAMMRGADGRYLTLTRRQLDTIKKAASA